MVTIDKYKYKIDSPLWGYFWITLSALTTDVDGSDMFSAFGIFQAQISFLSTPDHGWFVIRVCQ